MDWIQDYASLLPRFLPPSIYHPLFTLLSTGFALTRTLQTHLTPLLGRLMTQPDVGSLLALLVVLLVSLKVLEMMYRAVMFWVTLVVRLLVWAAVLVLGLWVWNRGVDGFVDDVQGLAEYWLLEYHRYSGEVKAFQAQKENQIRVQASRRKGGRGWR